MHVATTCSTSKLQSNPLVPQRPRNGQEERAEFFLGQTCCYSSIIRVALLQSALYVFLSDLGKRSNGREAVSAERLAFGLHDSGLLELLHLRGRTQYSVHVISWLLNERHCRINLRSTQ